MLQLPSEVRDLLARIEAFEASESVANTGTGARREGEGFEKLIGELWSEFEKVLKTHGATGAYVASGSRRWAKLTHQTRSLTIPSCFAGLVSGATPRWLEVDFSVSELLDAFPTKAEVIARYAPHTGTYADQLYPGIYQGLSTKFDDTLVLEDNGVLREKVLMEYKTAKSSKGRQIDGNAHERLSFQIMQYLEVATRYTRCSLHVMANGAFIRYRNKYHPNFHVQADRLKNFAWFDMGYSCTADEHGHFLSGLGDWLLSGTDRHA